MHFYKCMIDKQEKKIISLEHPKVNEYKITSDYVWWIQNDHES